MAIDFRSFRKVVHTVVKAKYPVMMRGRHGIGKSSVVYQIASELGLPVVERRASQMSDGDLLGLPVLDDEATNWNPPNWYKYACDNPCILFFDEVDRAPTETRQGLFELMDSRKISGHKLHPDVVIFSAVNGGEHGSQYQVADLDPAELDRYTVFDLEPTEEDFLDWAKPNFNVVLWDFLNQNRKHIEHVDDFEPGKVYPSRRSWARFNKAVSFDSGLLDAASPVLYQLANAFIGQEAAVALNDFVENYDRQVTAEDVLTGKALDLTKDFTVNEHNALCEKLADHESLDRDLTDAELLNLADYFMLLPSEVAMKLVQHLGSKGNNIIRLHKTTASNGRTVKSYIVEMLTGNNPEQNNGE